MRFSYTIQQAASDAASMAIMRRRAAQSARAIQVKRASENQAGHSVIQPASLLKSGPAANLPASLPVSMNQPASQATADTARASSQSAGQVSQAKSADTAEPASQPTGLFFSALLCSTSPPAETRLTVYRRSQHYCYIEQCLPESNTGAGSIGVSG